MGNMCNNTKCVYIKVEELTTDVHSSMWIRCVLFSLYRQNDTQRYMVSIIQNYAYIILKLFFSLVP